MPTAVLSGSLSELPAGEVCDVIDLKLALARPLERRQVVLAADGPFSVNLDGWTKVHLVKAEVVDAVAKVDIRITSADGSQQIIPVDPVFFFISQSVDITAIDLIRAAGQATTVDLILGQKL